MSINPPFHNSMMPGQCLITTNYPFQNLGASFSFLLFISSTVGPPYKKESTEDPYSFVDEETGANRTNAPVP